MASVIAVLNSKGGTGKTTLATNLAGWLHHGGARVLVVDTDPQGSARDWHHARPEGVELPAVVAMDRPTVHREIGSIGAPYDFVVIDGAAKLEQVAASALKAADLVLIPVQPSGFDLWAVADLVDAVHVRREVTDGRPQAAFVVSRQVAGTHLAAEVAEALGGLGLPVFAGRTSQRVAYAEAAQSGLTVTDYEPGGRAADEVRAIGQEALAVLGLAAPDDGATHAAAPTDTTNPTGP